MEKNVVNIANQELSIGQYNEFIVSLENKPFSVLFHNKPISLSLLASFLDLF